MSFILDALRKSEHERRLDAAPDIMRMPQAVARSRTPLWMAAGAGALVAAVLAVTLYLLLGPGEPRMPSAAAPQPSGGSAPNSAGLPPSTVNAAASSPPAEATALDAPPAAPPDTASVAGTEPQPRAGAGPASAPASAVASAAVESQPVAAPAAARTAPSAEAIGAASGTQSSARAGTNGRDAARLPSLAAIVAEGVSLPPLQMQLHVHSSSAANRFVVVNGSRYAPGDTLAEGPTLEEVVAEGAILSFRGRRFLLTPN